jgi:plastocyanin
VRFNPGRLSARADAPVAVTFDNQDASVNHDLVIYSPAGGIAAQADVITGPAQESISFTPSGAGNYAFKCSLHPQTMYGTIAIAP